MITVFQASDTLRCMVLNAPGSANLAAPRELIVRCRLLRNSTFWAQSLVQNPKRVTVGDWKGTKLSSLASARVRSGIRCWEIDRIHLQDLSQAFELLEQVVSSAGHQGAEKVFLRVLSNSKLVEHVKKIGFNPSFEEVHLAGVGVPLNPKINGFSFEHRTQADLHGLFQLYSAVTPPEIRQRIGMTLDQWKDAQEPAQAHRDESILKVDDKVVGWRTCDHFGKTTAWQTLGHPEHLDLTQHLIDISNQTHSWLIPDYQKHVAELLEQKGLQEFGRYTMLIKNVSVPVRNREFSYVEA